HRDAVERSLTEVAEGAHRGAARPPGQRAVRAAPRRARLLAAEARDLRAPVAAEQPAGAGARRAGARDGMRGKLDRARHPRGRLRVARGVSAATARWWCWRPPATRAPRSP